MPQKISITDIIAYLILGLACIGLAILCINYWPDIMRIVSSPQAIEDWLAGFGPWAPVVFIAAQFLQVVVFVIPGEVTQLAGGFLFGIGPGLLYSLIGIGLGSTFAFLVARKLGLAFVTRLFGATQVGKFESFISSSKAIVAFFLLFVIPGIPKDILCYVAGLSYLPLGMFLAISLIGRLPALLGSVIIGHAAADQNWPVLIAIAVVASVLFVLGLIFRKQIHERIAKLAHRHSRPTDSRNEGATGKTGVPGTDDPAQSDKLPDSNGPGDYRQDD